MERKFEGKTAVVVGGSGGLGRSLSVALLGEGASVIAIGRHEVPGTHSVILDLDIASDRSKVLEFVRKADILCNVRGPFLQKDLADTSASEWESIVYANLTFPGMLVSAALPHMCEEQWGKILLFGGTRTDTIRAFRTNAAYAAAKTGLSSLVKSVALGYASSGIMCNAVCPGFVDTEYLERGQKEALAAKNPDGKLILPDRIAEMAVFLLENDDCNGVILPIDKAWSPGLI